MTKAWLLSIASALIFSIASPATAEDKAPADRDVAAAPREEQRVATRHQLGSIGYTATAGTLTIRSDDGVARASMFYVAYVADRPKGAPERPLTFMFNGGPGSSSIWLHMGSFAPVRVPTAAPGATSSAPQRLMPNQYSLLGTTDMVFLDAIGTGYSRAFDAADNKRFWGHDQDSASFVAAITRYLELNDRWNAPKYLFGESYGTTRSAILVERLQEKGIELNGIVMMSSILNFANLASGLDQSAINLLPTYAALAWHHNRVPHGGEGFDAFIERARRFARGRYAAALAQGHDIADAERDAVAQELAGFIGLSPEYLKRANLSVDAGRFRRELLRDRGLSIGGTDGRFTLAESDAAAERPSADPAFSAVLGPYVTSFKQYLPDGLHYDSKLDYVPLAEGKIMSAWDWSHQPPAPEEKQISMANVVLDLGTAMRRNPRLKLLMLNGYYDLSTPFFATEYDIAHLHLPPALRGNIAFRYYRSGHMIYLEEGLLGTLKGDIVRFYEQSR